MLKRENANDPLRTEQTESDALQGNTNMNDESLMPYGAHKGKRMGVVPACYLLWLYENGRCNREVKAYIENNLEVLYVEAERNPHARRRSRCYDCSNYDKFITACYTQPYCKHTMKPVRWDDPACIHFTDE